jgi:signal transduction histidine kinase/CheY-like chemotaxis protein/HAMP domain-containing protein
MAHFSPGIRTKLIFIFILIKVVPLMVLAWFAWEEIHNLGDTVETSYVSMIAGTGEVVKGVSELSTQNSIRALDQKSQEAIERLTTDTARAVAAFLYDRDRDVLQAAQLPLDRDQYRRFLSSHRKPVILHDPWVMNPNGDAWIPNRPFDPNADRVVSAKNDDNRRDFNYRAPDYDEIVEHRPTYLEMTFVDLTGMEQIKVTTSEILPNALTDISDPKNTYCRAEHYYRQLKALRPGEIYVSEVIGPYVKTHMIGPYTKSRAAQLGKPFAPEQSGYAGKENPVGIRFQGLIRWATPVLQGDKIIGYVTLALDHTHLMEFTDHLVPTDERYSAISDAASGNYAFMWDYQGRNISHPRDYFIVGYDPLTGEQAVPWLDEEMYTLWSRSDQSMTRLQKTAPQFKAQSLAKKPAQPLTEAGFVGLDGRYLNFAPQCSGWHNLTQYGGSGSFLIFWSGLWKLTTAAAIPYRTGIYGDHPRGFGYVTIGANVDEFHRPALETAQTINSIEERFHQKLNTEKQENKTLIDATLQKAFWDLSLYTGIMVVIVIGIAVFMAGAMTRRITHLIYGIRRLQQGDRGYRLIPPSKDEMGQLAEAYNEMAEAVQGYIGDMEASRAELARHRDNLEVLVQERTHELEVEIEERKKVEAVQTQSEARLRMQNHTLLRLARDEALYTGELKTAMKVIMEAAGRALQVERSSVWLFDEHRLKAICHEIYLLSEDRHTQCGDFRIEDFPTYLTALQTGRSVVSSDVNKDERLIEFSKEYFPSYDIQSMLDTSIVSDGEPIGIVCFEQEKTKRQWHIDEENFAHSIADLISLAVGTNRARQEAKEKAQLEQRLQRVEKMEALGTLAGGVAHDLNNILSGLVSYPELLLHQMSDDDAMRKPVETILKAGKRATTIVQDLLTLARRGVEVTEVLNLNEIVRDYLKSPEHKKIVSFHPRMNITCQLSPDLLNIRGSSAHLSKAIMNMVINAAEAMKDGGAIHISTHNTYIDRPIKGYDMVKDGDYAALTIEDSGIGISDEDMEHIFEPFYTKKKMGRSGTGLGMAVVWGVAKDHNGYIDCESREGQGTRFTLYFPVTRKAIQKKHLQTLDEYRGQGESILIVDDIQEQREIASAILVELGYEVITVPSGEQAVEYLRDRRVDLIVLDMIMDPGMDGLDAYREILRKHPSQKAIIASGFTETDRLKEVLRLGASQYLKKPYTIDKIGRSVQSALKGN